jgi:hypothetical protein
MPQCRERKMEKEGRMTGFKLRGKHVRAASPAAGALSPLPIQRACHDKVLYLTELIAKVQASRAQQRYGKVHLEPYLCPYCGFFHLTTQHKKGTTNVSPDRI